MPVETRDQVKRRLKTEVQVQESENEAVEGFHVDSTAPASTNYRSLLGQLDKAIRVLDPAADEEDELENDNFSETAAAHTDIFSRMLDEVHAEQKFISARFQDPTQIYSVSLLGGNGDGKSLLVNTEALISEIPEESYGIANPHGEKDDDRLRERLSSELEAVEYVQKLSEDPQTFPFPAQIEDIQKRIEFHNANVEEPRLNATKLNTESNRYISEDARIAEAKTLADFAGSCHTGRTKKKPISVS
jgi:hypothetical protein